MLTRPLTVTICLLATIGLPPWLNAGQRQGPGILTTAALESYVGQFNAQDQEEGVNTIPNHDALIFLANNIPLLDCPDQEIEQTYYYRWWTYRKHIRKTVDGYVITEFYPDVSWAQKHNVINCPAGHHVYEGRWLRDPVYLKDYIRFYFDGPGEPGGQTKCYSNWLVDAVYAQYLVTHDRAFVTGLLDDLIANHRSYEVDGAGPHQQSRFLKDIGLYWSIDSWDGSEFSIGGTGVRPSINSYQYGSSVAIANIAALAGRTDVAEVYRKEAETLRRLTQERLWDPEARFFKVLRDERAQANYGNRMEEACAFGDRVTVRELYGYAPWYFNLPEAGHGFEEAWAQLSDSQGFKAPYGPTFAERRHPKFMINQDGCIWSGSSWPLATSQTLTALANVLNSYDQNVIGRQEYFDTLKAYTRSHVWQGHDGATVPWIDESVNPDTGQWIVSGHFPKTRGRYYNHSTYCDLIITGLVGLRPRADNTLEVNPLVPGESWAFFCLDRVPYHGRILTILWDKTGETYGKGQGLTLLVDGKKIANSTTLQRVTGQFK